MPQLQESYGLTIFPSGGLQTSVHPEIQIRTTYIYVHQSSQGIFLQSRKKHRADNKVYITSILDLL